MQIEERDNPVTLVVKPDGMKSQEIEDWLVAKKMQLLNHYGNKDMYRVL